MNSRGIQLSGGMGNEMSKLLGGDKYKYKNKYKHKKIRWSSTWSAPLRSRAWTLSSPHSSTCASWTGICICICNTYTCASWTATRRGRCPSWWGSTAGTWSSLASLAWASLSTRFQSQSRINTNIDRFLNTSWQGNWFSDRGVPTRAGKKQKPVEEFAGLYFQWEVHICGIWKWYGHWKSEFCKSYLFIKIYFISRCPAGWLSLSRRCTSQLTIIIVTGCKLPLIVNYN